MRKSLALILVLVFSCIVYLQHHHHHHDEKAEVSASAMLKKASHCQICDHFFHYKHTSFISEVFHFDFTYLIQPPVLGGIHILGNYASVVQSFSNKGPPVLI